MRAILWLVGLFALASAGAWMLVSNDGLVSIFLAPYRIDLSLNLAVLVLLGLVLGLLLVQRALVALLSLPRQARRWRLLQRERAAHAALFEAMADFQAGRFVRARKAAQQALEREASLQDDDHPLPHAPSLRALAHLLSAEAAHALQDPALRESHWQQALGAAAQASGHVQASLTEGLHLRQARWQLDQRDASASLAVLAQLAPAVLRRTATMRLQLKAAQLAGQTGQALETAQLLAKHRAFSPMAAQSLLRRLALQWLQAQRDPGALTSAWSRLPEALRHSPEVATAAVQRLLALDGDRAQARQWLLPVWEAALSSGQRSDWLALVLALRATLRGDDPASADTRAWLARIETAQQRQPGEPLLQFLAGMACHQQQLWGKAQHQMQQALKGALPVALQRQAWQVLAELAEQRQDSAAALHAWRQAAQLELNT